MIRFVGSRHTTFQRATPSCFPASGEPELCCSRSSPAFGAVCSDFGLSGRLLWSLIVLICMSLRTSDAKHLFYVLNCHSRIFGEAPTKTFGSFLNWVVCSLIVEF